MPRAGQPVAEGLLSSLRQLPERWEPSELHQRLVSENFQFISLNLSAQLLQWDMLWSQLKRLSGFDLLLVLPRQESPLWIVPALPELRVPLIPFELVLLYLRPQDPALLSQVAALLAQLKALLRRRRPLDFGDLKEAQPTTPAQAHWVQSPRRLENRSPKYPVEVRNELFHHGNLEALGRVVRDYEETFPLLKVRLFHQGEEVRELYSLFQWGRVRFGDRIWFQIEGPAFSEVAKLRALLCRACGPQPAQIIRSGARYFK
ncbi:MAG: hypothetical protein RRB13_14840 [bacterium]|nr:hypothetical protein [bacterium]